MRYWSTTGLDAMQVSKIVERVFQITKHGLANSPPCGHPQVE
jgi:hypothetical protein